MSKERISASVDPEVKEWLEDLPNTSEFLNSKAKAEMAAEGLNEEERLESELEDVEEEIEEKEAEINDLESERDYILSQLEEVRESKEEQRESIYEALCLVKGSNPSVGDRNYSNAAEKAGLTEAQVKDIEAYVDLGYYRAVGFPDDIDEEEKEAADEWIDSEL